MSVRYIILNLSDLPDEPAQSGLTENQSKGLRTRYDYDPWGRRVNVNGGDVEADFGFTGHYYHARSGLHLALYRAYSAELGRWLSRDPLGEPTFEAPRLALQPALWLLRKPAELIEGSNLYEYGGNDPIKEFDLLGNALCCKSGARSHWPDLRWYERIVKRPSCEEQMEVCNLRCSYDYEGRTGDDKDCVTICQRDCMRRFLNCLGKAIF